MRLWRFSVGVGLLVFGALRNSASGRADGHMTPTPHKPRTLIVVIGQYRSLDLVVTSIVENLVKPNMPCDVVLSLDGPEVEVSGLVYNLLQPYLTLALFAEPGDRRTPGGMLEFFQLTKALRRVDTTAYDFLAKTRSDAYIQRPLHFRRPYAADDSFSSGWSTFLHALPLNVTPQTAVFSWFMTAGMPFYLPMMVNTVPSMPWSMMNQYDVNADLIASVRAHTAVLGPSFLDNHAAVARLVSRLARQYHLVYLCGSNWLHWGPHDDFVRIAFILEAEYGNLTWLNITGRNASFGPYVAEAHVRLAHIKENVSLIDLANGPDYDVTFDGKFYGFNSLTRSQALSVWLVRPWQLKELVERSGYLPRNETETNWLFASPQQPP